MPTRAAAGSPGPGRHARRPRRGVPEFRRLALAVAAAVACLQAPLAAGGAAPVVPRDVECGVRRLMWNYTKALLPERGDFVSVFDALQLAALCGDTRPRAPGGRRGAVGGAQPPVPRAALSVHADAVRGSDSGAGTPDDPVRSLGAAIDRARRLRAGSRAPLDVVLANGTYELNETLVLGPADSFTSIRAAPGAAPVVSGGAALPNGTVWTPCGGDECVAPGTVVTRLPREILARLPPGRPSLFVGGGRSVLARFPNGNPETQGMNTPADTGYVPASGAAWAPPRPTGPAEVVNVTSPVRNGSQFPAYEVGVGGPAAVFDPPVSVWALRSPRHGATYVVPSGLSSAVLANRTWRPGAEVGAVVHTFQENFWGSWQFVVESRGTAAAGRNATLSWKRGGFQEARGGRSGGPWYVEGVLDELDAPGEFFVNRTSGALYLLPNATEPPAGPDTVVPLLETLVAVRGEPGDPAVNVSLVGLTFRHTACTALSPHLVPSGGDWAVHAGAAVEVSGAESPVVGGCAFDAVGGNGLLVSGRVRGALVTGNEFAWSGQSAVLLLGSCDGFNCTGGDQPRGTVVAGNVMREFGVFGKQTGGLFQALSVGTRAEGNVIFSGPRGGVNFNDGCGGGHAVLRNAMFNLVRETADGGPFNSWDRLMYEVDGAINPAPSVIRGNFLVCLAGVETWPIDHDDGSQQYADHGNVLAFAGFKSYLGHSLAAANNLYIMPDANPYFGYCATSSGDAPGLSGYGEEWSNNTCIMAGPGPVYQMPAAASPRAFAEVGPRMSGNTLRVPAPDLPAGGPLVELGGSLVTLSAFRQASGQDAGLVVNFTTPSASEIVEAARAMLVPRPP